MLTPRRSMRTIESLGDTSTLDPAELLDPGPPTSGDEALARAILAGMMRAAIPAWHSRAACKDRGDLDFTSTHPTVKAKCFTVCGQCDVRAECLEWAIELEDTAAILGGADPAARRRLIAQRSTQSSERAS